MGPDERATRQCVLALFASADDRRDLDSALQCSRWERHFALTPEEFAGVAGMHQIDVLMTDSVLCDGRSWKDLLQLLRAADDAPPLIVADRLGDERLWAELLNLGAYDLIMTPFDQRELLHVLSNAYRYRRRDLQPSDAHKTAERAFHDSLSIATANAA